MKGPCLDRESSSFLIYVVASGSNAIVILLAKAMHEPSWFDDTQM